MAISRSWRHRSRPSSQLVCEHPAPIGPRGSGTPMKMLWYACEEPVDPAGRCGRPAGRAARGAGPAGKAASAMTTTVLLVEDERKLRELLRSYLERAGFTVLSTGSGAEAITLASSAAPGLVILDLGLPDVPGESVARELRAIAPTPILMLTAKSSEEDRIRGLELGADDYVTKPFSPRELVLRVQAIVRRGRERDAEGERAAFGGGELTIDESRRELVIRGEPV